jgi:hypothetical protein
MTCIIQETENRNYLREDGGWTSDFNEALEFTTIRQTLEHKRRLNLPEATVLVFRDKHVYRLEQGTLVPLRPNLELVPVDL